MKLAKRRNKSSFFIFLKKDPKTNIKGAHGQPPEDKDSMPLARDQ
jgi:hypothetical protein